MTIQRDKEIAAEYNAAMPEAAYLHQLIRNYALEQGGQVLAMWRKLEGPLFGENTTMRTSTAARELKLPLSKVEAMRRETIAIVWPLWIASPQYAEYQIAKRRIAERAMSGRDVSGA